MAEEKRQLDRSRDFVERYANNVRFESTFWDLKVLLGYWDQSIQTPDFVVHTAMPSSVGTSETDGVLPVHECAVSGGNLWRDSVDRQNDSHAI